METEVIGFGALDVLSVTQKDTLSFWVLSIFKLHVLDMVNNALTLIVDSGQNIILIHAGFC